MLVRLDTGKHLILREDQVRKRQGQQLGGMVKAARGRGFTSESGRAAGIKGNAARHRPLYGAYGLHLRTFARAARRPQVARKPLRERYTHERGGGAYYDPTRAVWVREAQTLQGVDYPECPISETAALRLLGHLPKRRRTTGIPVAVLTTYTPGFRRSRAEREREERLRRQQQEEDES